MSGVKVKTVFFNFVKLRTYISLYIGMPSRLLFKQKKLETDSSRIVQSLVKRKYVSNGRTDRKRYGQRRDDMECGKTGKGPFVFTAQPGMSVCVHGLSTSISLSHSVETVNTDASECLRKQRQSPVQTHKDRESGT